MQGIKPEPLQISPESPGEGVLLTDPPLLLLGPSHPPAGSVPAAVSALTSCFALGLQDVKIFCPSDESMVEGLGFHALELLLSQKGQCGLSKSFTAVSGVGKEPGGHI